MSARDRRQYDALLIAKLAAGGTQDQAAAAASCSPKTVVRRMKDPKFRAELDEARKQLFEAAFGRVVAAAQAAAGTLITLLARDSPPATRLGAARTLLESSVKFREQHEIAERVRALEERLIAQKPSW